MNRRHFIASAAGLLIAGPAIAQTAPVMQVAKTPTCGCCTAWVERMISAGFAVEVEDVDQEVLWAMKD
ncbi:DUF411 domain-containing protein, partial [Loktanella agnita]